MVQLMHRSKFCKSHEVKSVLEEGLELHRKVMFTVQLLRGQCARAAATLLRCHSLCWHLVTNCLGSHLEGPPGTV